MNKSTLNPTVSYSFTMRLTYPNRIGTFAHIVNAIGRHKGDLGAVNIISPDAKVMTRDVTVQARDSAHQHQIVSAIRRLSGVKVADVSDRVFLLHLGGKLAIQNKVPITSRDILSMAYTPGVARVCEAIAADPSKMWQFTIKNNSVAIITDGTAVLGLGNIGPEAAMPVMEGKAMLFKEFANIDAYPICLATEGIDEIVATVKRLAVGFGGINLEDISAPRCFDIERKLQEQLNIPVFHDDQHGTAVVVLAALLNALRLTRQKLECLKVVISGAGAAGVAITQILQRSGVRDIILCDRKGILHDGRLPDLNESKTWLVKTTNPRKLRGQLPDALRGANVFIGVSGPGILEVKDLKRMAPRSIIFALANPTPEIMPEEAAQTAFIVATGRSDYANQINNVLAFPGIFRGALNVRARQITGDMIQAAARAIASCVRPSELSPEYIVPSVFNQKVVRCVAEAVQQVAIKSGVAGK